MDADTDTRKERLLQEIEDALTPAELELAEAKLAAYQRTQ